MKNRSRSSTPTRPVLIPRSANTRAMARYGLSSSSHVRMSLPKRMSSRARSSSNLGQTQAISPLAGRIQTKVRSLSHQLTPAKYSRLVPPSTRIASRPFSAMSRRARSWRAARSSSVMRAIPEIIGLSRAIGESVLAADAACPAAETAIVAPAAPTVIFIKLRRSMGSVSFLAADCNQAARQKQSGYLSPSLRRRADCGISYLFPSPRKEQHAPPHPPRLHPGPRRRRRDLERRRRRRPDLRRPQLPDRPRLRPAHRERPAHHQGRPHRGPWLRGQDHDPGRRRNHRRRRSCRLPGSRPGPYELLPAASPGRSRSLRAGRAADDAPSRG